MPPCPLSTVRSLAMSEERRVRRFSLGGDSDLKVTVAVGSEGRRRGMCKAAAAYAHTSEPPPGGGSWNGARAGSPAPLSASLQSPGGLALVLRQAWALRSRRRPLTRVRRVLLPPQAESSSLLSSEVGAG